MAFDVRGLPTTAALVLGHFTAAAGAPAGFTAGQRYWPLALGIDCAPAQPVIYALVADDTGAIRSVQASAFTWSIDFPA